MTNVFGGANTVLFFLVAGTFQRTLSRPRKSGEKGTKGRTAKGPEGRTEFMKEIARGAARGGEGRRAEDTKGTGNE